MVPWYFTAAGALLSTLTHGLSLLVFSGEEANPFRRERSLSVWSKCAGIAAATALVGLFSFPVGWVLANMASFVGIKIGFQLPMRLACLVFFTNFVIFQSVVWLLVSLI